MKRINSKKFIGGLALAGSLLLTGAIGFAQQRAATASDGQEQGERHGQHRGDREGGFAGHFGKNLNLTDAQKQQMQQIAAKYREGNKAFRQQNRIKGGENGERESAFNGGTFDETAFRAAAQARANAHVEMEVTHARMMSEMYNVLTTEQKAQLAAQREQWKQKREAWRANNKANSNQSNQ